MTDQGLDERLRNVENLVSRSVSYDVINTRALVRILVEGRWLLSSIVAISIAVAVAFALWLPNEYRASAILEPSGTSNSSLLSGIAGQIGGLGSLAGLDIGSDGGSDKTVVAMELLTTWGFVDSFISEREIQADVFAASGWDRQNNVVTYDDDLYDAQSGRWVRDYDPDEGETAQPTSWELYEEFRERLRVRQDARTSLITVSFDHYSPTVAKQWVDEIVAAVNSELQHRDKVDAEKRIAYLQAQIDRTSLSEMREVFYSLIEEQTKNLMLAEVSDEYVFRTISPARVPEEKIRPKRALICIAGLIAGIILGIFVVGLTAYARSWREAAAA